MQTGVQQPVGPQAQQMGRQQLVWPQTQQMGVPQVGFQNQMGMQPGGYAPHATAAVDTTGDGRANALVRGVDRNHDGIPDVLQGGGMMGNEMGTLQASLQMLNGAIESLSQSVSSPNHCQTQLVGAGHLNNPRLRRCVLPSAIGLP